MDTKISGPVERTRERQEAERAGRPRRRPIAVAGRLMFFTFGALVLAMILFAGLLYVAPQRLAPVNDYLADGEIAAPGLVAPVRIRRDGNGTPYVFADTLRDAYYGQGFALAQDRLFQMELARLYAAGRLSEFAGGDFLPGDRMARAMGVRRLAAKRMAALDAASMGELEAFAAGMNAFVSQRPQDLPYELRLLGQSTVEPWTPLDLMSIVYLQSWFFSIPMLDAELTAQAILERFDGDETVAEAFFPFVENPDEPGSGAERDAARAAAARPYEDLKLDVTAPLWGRGRDGDRKKLGASLESGASGSNNWAFSGARMGRKSAVIANDPHLDIRRLPGPWHPVGLFTKDGVRAIGASVGLPGLFIGRNADIGFAVTVGYADVIDYYVETIDPARPGWVLEGAGADAEWVKARPRVEEILVLGENGLETERFEFWETPRGPILPDFGLVGRKDRALSLRWSVASDAMAARSSYRFEPILRAGDLREAITAIEGFAEASLNFVVGDAEGRVGSRSTGFVPNRAQGDGLTPLPAAAAQEAWSGYISGRAMPGELNPLKGWVGTANHFVAKRDFAKPYSDMVSPAFRYRRMKALFDGDAPLSPKLAAQAQRDVVNLLAEKLTPIIVAALEGDPERRLETAAAAEVLSGWNRRDEADAAGPLVFQEVLRHVAVRLYEPSLGSVLARKMLTRREFWQERFAQIFPQASGPVFDKAGVDGVIGRDVLIRQATVEAMAELERLHGSDPATWRWGDALQVRFDGPAPAPAGFEFAAAAAGLSVGGDLRLGGVPGSRA